VTLPAALGGALAGGGLLAAVLEENSLPLLSADSGVLLVGSLAFLGVPVAIGLGALMAAGTWLGRRAGFPAGAWAPVGLAAVGAAVWVVLLARAPGAAGLFLHRHLALGLFLAALGIWTLRGGRAARAGPVATFATCLAWTLLAPVAAGRVPLREIEAVGPVLQASAARARTVLLLGVDGLCRETLRRWEESGGSEAYRWLRERSYVGALRSAVPTGSPRLWTSIATGMNPEDHGILSFTSWEVRGVAHRLAGVPRFEGAFAWMRPVRWLGLAGMGPVSSDQLRRPPFWEIVQDGVPAVGVVGWWGTWPATPLRGSLVSDRFYFWREESAGHERATFGLTWPPDLELRVAPLRRAPEEITPPEIARLTGHPPEAGEFAGPFRRHELASELPLALTMDETHFAVAEELLRRAPDGGVFAFYFRGNDLVGHAALRYSGLYPEVPKGATEAARYGAVVSAYYGFVFERLRSLIEEAGDDAVALVVSDHGFERLGERDFGHENAPPGVIVATGPGVDTRATGVDAGILDVAPTLLWLAGYPVADDMPGRPLRDLFPGLAGATGPFPRVPTYGRRVPGSGVPADALPETERRMLDLLRTLGYLD
jgi:hypothetical protein